MHFIVHGQHLCVTLIGVVWTHLVHGALGDDLVGAADDLRIARLVAPCRRQIVHPAAHTCACVAIITVLRVQVSDAT